MIPSITRRQFLKTSTAGSLSLASLGCSALAPALSSVPSDHSRAGEYNIYFGDLHNHSEVGYARGSLERAFEIASTSPDSQEVCKRNMFRYNGALCEALAVMAVGPMVLRTRLRAWSRRWRRYDW